MSAAMSAAMNAGASRVLVVNAGSSSLKIKLLPDDLALTVERIGAEAALSSSLEQAGTPKPSDVHDHTSAFHYALMVLEHAHSGISEHIQAVGHRVVHGGERYRQAVRIDDDVIEGINDLIPLAPLHNPANLEGIRAARKVLANVPQVAVFDTAFHSSLPPVAYLYGLPKRFYDQHGIRRYGFHGTSHAYVSQQAADMLGRNDLKIVTLHLGNGASAAAVDAGVSVDTSMGFTPLAGLLMGTRSGDLDPSVVLQLMRQGMSADEVDTLLNKQSGLLGVSGVSNDMRDVEKAAAAGDEDARAAFAMFCYRVKKTIGAYAAALGGLDAVVFTAGIGEHDSDVREASLAGLEFLGIQLDSAKNQQGEGDIASTDSRVRVLVIPTDEEGMIAAETRRLVL